MSDRRVTCHSAKSGTQKVTLSGNQQTTSIEVSSPRSVQQPKQRPVRADSTADSADSEKQQDRPSTRQQSSAASSSTELASHEKQTCRLCASRLPDGGVPVSGQEGRARRLHLKILVCLPLQVSATDAESLVICKSCVEFLDSSYRLVLACLLAQHELGLVSQAPEEVQYPSSEVQIRAVLLGGDLPGTSTLLSLLQEQPLPPFTEQRLALISEVAQDTSVPEIGTRPLPPPLKPPKQKPVKQAVVKKTSTRIKSKKHFIINFTPSEDLTLDARIEELAQQDPCIIHKYTEPSDVPSLYKTTEPQGKNQVFKYDTKTELGPSTSNPQPAPTVSLPKPAPGGTGIKKAIILKLIPNRAAQQSTTNRPTITFTEPAPRTKFSLLKAPIIEDAEPKLPDLEPDEAEPEDAKKEKPRVVGFSVLKAQGTKRELESIITFPPDEDHRKRGRYECRLCGEEYANYFQLLKHTKNYHGKVLCQHCPDYVGDSMEARAVGHRQYGSSCPRASKRPVLPPGEVPTYKIGQLWDCHCRVCNERFPNFLKYRMHMRLEHDTFICKFCPGLHKEDYDKSSAEHRKPESGCRRVQELKPYKCPECDLTFRVPSHLRYHMNLHTKNKEFMCDRCGKSFTNPHSMRNHRAHHDELRHECSKCSRSFHTLNAKQKHCLMVHNKKWRLECRLCDQVMSTDLAAMEHLEQEHPDQQGVKLEDSFERTSEYRCDACGKYCGTKFHLRKHKYKEHRPLFVEEGEVIELDLAEAFE